MIMTCGSHTSVTMKGERGSGWRKERGSVVISHAWLTWIRAGLWSWRATRANVAILYVFSLSCAKYVVATGKMLYGEAPPAIMLKS
jgi:hypothetical protein